VTRASVASRALALAAPLSRIPRALATIAPSISTVAAALLLALSSASCALAASPVVWEWDRGPAWVRDFPRPRDARDAD